MYLRDTLAKYSVPDLDIYSHKIAQLKRILKLWAGDCYIDILDSGSRAKNTAISLSSDVDLLVSLTSDCNENCGGLQSIYAALYNELRNNYSNVRKQNVSVRITLPKTSLLFNDLEIDITPARKLVGNTNNHSLWVSKLSTWKQTNIQRHINDVSNSGRTNEIKLLKIWRELNKLDFPSIYIEYLLINNILKNKPSDKNKLEDNFWSILLELAKSNDNPLFSTIIDPANSNNVLSNLLKPNEKTEICYAAKKSIDKKYWEDIVW